ADVAIRAGSEPTSKDVIPRRVCGIAVALYGSHGYIRKHGGPKAPEDLALHRIVRADQARSQLAMEKFLDRYVSSTASVYRSNSMLARTCAVRDGIGVGMLPCFVADLEPELARIGPVQPDASAALWILVHADLRRNALAKRFVTFVHESLFSMRRRFEGQS
ncbi:MAG: hypothetical protein H0T52_10210, partial [Lautropia sp.]|nr:hypothetical protein [Lautropia sp.]